MDTLVGNPESSAYLFLGDALSDQPENCFLPCFHNLTVAQLQAKGKVIPCAIQAGEC
jgi:hypothetical protein